jgi:hypothetical protein
VVVSHFDGNDRTCSKADFSGSSITSSVGSALGLEEGTEDVPGLAVLIVPVLSLRIL